MYFLQFFKAKNVRHEPRAVLLNNASPSDLPVNCSWFSTLLGIPESTSLNNCCKWLHIFMRARAHAEAQHRRVWTRCQIMRHALMLLTFFFLFFFSPLPSAVRVSVGLLIPQHVWPESTFLHNCVDPLLASDLIVAELMRAYLWAAWVQSRCDFSDGVDI